MVDKFPSADFVEVLVAKFESGQLARWNEGDWYSDGFFAGRDFVVAFAEGATFLHITINKAIETGVL